MNESIMMDKISDVTRQDIMQRFEGRKVKEDPDILPYREAFRALNNPIQYRTEWIGLVGGLPMGAHVHSLRVQNQTEFLMCHKVTQKQQTAATIP